MVYVDAMQGDPDRAEYADPDVGFESARDVAHWHTYRYRTDSYRGVTASCVPGDRVWGCRRVDFNPGPSDASAAGSGEARGR